ncbi:MAG TPA: hypothetical protein VN921_04295 [Chthoniobacterales bacterium]|nr:hypothetical protein [Chthoniobacterales bacterium]
MKFHLQPAAKWHPTGRRWFRVSLGLKLLFVTLFPVLAYCREPDISKMPWPQVIRDFPSGEQAAFTSGRYRISRRFPADPAVRAEGGSGGPVIEITLRDLKSHWFTILTEQSIAERLLEPYAGRPQIEIWGRGGGGYWTRCLYRYVSHEYRCVRIDEFEDWPRHNNEKASTTKPPLAPHGKGDDLGKIFYFVETRLPNT